MIFTVDDPQYKRNFARVYRASMTAQRNGPFGGQSSGRSGARFKRSVDDEEDQQAVFAKRFAEVDRINELDDQMGFGAFSVGPPRLGWMINMTQVIDNCKYHISFIFRRTSRMRSGLPADLQWITTSSKKMGPTSK